MQGSEREPVISPFQASHSCFCSTEVWSCASTLTEKSRSSPDAAGGHHLLQLISAHALKSGQQCYVQMSYSAAAQTIILSAATGPNGGAAGSSTVIPWESQVRQF